MLDFGLVSIIMPSYNCEKYIKKSIDSVVAQTYSNWELIVVDDCSNDNTVRIIESYCDSRIKLFVNEKNSGAALSRNKALREARGRWVAFLDSDDIWFPSKLQLQMEFMVKNNYSFSFTDYRICRDGRLESVVRTGPAVLNYKRILKYCYCFTSTVIIDTKTVGIIQIVDLKKNNDYAMWLQALKKTNGYRFQKCLAYYVKHNDSISSASLAKLIKWHYILFRRGCGFSKIRSFLLTLGNLWFGFFKKYHYRIRIKKYEKINGTN